MNATLGNFLLVGALGVSALTAQVPVGSAVVGTIHDSSNPASTGAPGLFVIDLADGATRPITNLPPGLTAPETEFLNGINSVSLRSSDGAIVVGAVTRGVVNVYVFYLAGLAVDASRTKVIPVGTTGATGQGAVFATVLPDDRLYVIGLEADTATGYFTSGALTGTRHATIDLATTPPTLAPLPPFNVPPGEAAGGGFVIDPSGRVAYSVVSSSFHEGPCVSQIWQLDLTTRQNCLLATMIDECAIGTAIDDDGTLYVSATRGVLRGQPEHLMHEFRPSGCGAAPRTSVVSDTQILASGLGLDRERGVFVGGAASLPGATGSLGNSLVRIAADGAVRELSPGPAGGWALVSPLGVAVRNAFASYGPTTDGDNRYWFDTFPNPGGDPFVGDPDFSLTSRSAPGTALASALFLAAGRFSAPILGIELLVDPTILVTVPIAPQAAATIPLPVPNDPALMGGTFTAQTVHAEAGGAFAASRGLAVTIR
ncbi:MAG: hypothetical protein AAF628_15125 [Planctomycetota bacterium]